jgi:hypothetical protein
MLDVVLKQGRHGNVQFKDIISNHVLFLNATWRHEDSPRPSFFWAANSNADTTTCACGPSNLVELLTQLGDQRSDGPSLLVRIFNDFGSLTTEGCSTGKLRGSFPTNSTPTMRQVKPSSLRRVELKFSLSSLGEKLRSDVAVRPSTPWIIHGKLGF